MRPRIFFSIIIFLSFFIPVSFAQTISSVTYNSGNGILVINGSGMNTAEPIDATKFTISNGIASFILTTSTSVNPSSDTEATIIVNTNDRLYLYGILNNNGSISAGGGGFNLEAAANWNGSPVAADAVNLINVSNYLVPTITDATYDAGTGNLAATGTRFAKVASASDIIATQFTITGKSGGTRTLSSTSNVNTTDETHFTLTISGADKTAVDALIDKNGTSASDNTVYNIAAANGWNNVPSVVNADALTPITASGVNQAPTDISLSNNTVAENSPTGTTIGTLSTTDPDNTSGFTYSLVSGSGDTDNGSFNIVGNTLQTNAVFNFEAKSTYTIRIQSTDPGNATFSKQFTILITNVNEAPTNITLSNNTIAENVPANSVIGTFTASDPDAGETFTFTLVSGPGDTDNSSFTITGNQLRIISSPNYEVKNSYTVRVRVTDSGNDIRNQFYNKHNKRK